jgi:hypothetical protein
LFDGSKSAGNHIAVWDGRTKAGKNAASGVFFYKMETAEFTETRKMLLLK